MSEFLSKIFGGKKEDPFSEVKIPVIEEGLPIKIPEKRDHPYLADDEKTFARYSINVGEVVELFDEPYIVLGVSKNQNGLVVIKLDIKTGKPMVGDKNEILDGTTQAHLKEQYGIKLLKPPYNTVEGLLRRENEKIVKSTTKDEIAFLGDVREEKPLLKFIETKYNEETITLNLEQKLQEFTNFYKTHKIDTPPNFEDTIRKIWQNNSKEIKKAIQEQGFNDILLIPGNLPLPALHTEMTERYNTTLEGEHFKSGGSFAGATSQGVDKPRIVLVHNAKNLEDHPELKKTLNDTGEDAMKREILTLEDYLVFQRIYFAKTGQHLDEKGWT